MSSREKLGALLGHPPDPAILLRDNPVVRVISPGETWLFVRGFGFVFDPAHCGRPFSSPQITIERVQKGTAMGWATQVRPMGRRSTSRIQFPSEDTDVHYYWRNHSDTNSQVWLTNVGEVELLATYWSAGEAEFPEHPASPKAFNEFLRSVRPEGAGNFPIIECQKDNGDLIFWNLPENFGEADPVASQEWAEYRERHLPVREKNIVREDQETTP